MDSTTQTKDVTPENVRKFLLTRSSEPITAIEDEFRIQLDLALLDAEDLTKIGPNRAPSVGDTANSDELKDDLEKYEHVQQLAQRFFAAKRRNPQAPQSPQP
jgi:hypothetical protein